MQEELVQLRAEVAQLRGAQAPAASHTPDVELTPLSECPEYPPIEAPVVPDDHAREVAEYAALKCGIGYIKTVRPEPKPVVTYYVDRSGQRWCKTRVGNRASSTRCD